MKMGAQQGESLQDVRECQRLIAVHDTRWVAAWGVASHWGAGKYGEPFMTRQPLWVVAMATTPQPHGVVSLFVAAKDAVVRRWRVAGRGPFWEEEVAPNAVSASCHPSLIPSCPPWRPGARMMGGPPCF